MILFLTTKNYLFRLGLESPLSINKGLGSFAKKEIKLADVITKKIEILRTYLRDELI